MVVQKIIIKMGEDELKPEIIEIASPNLVNEQTEQLKNVFLQPFSDEAINFDSTESQVISRGELRPCH